MTEHKISVTRTARYLTSGAENDATDVWYLLHGYGQRPEVILKSTSALAAQHRLLVAPEALSRFYVAERATVRSHAEARVGASWMTRESRNDEIADYVRYLDAVHREVSATTGQDAAVVVFGFSQGVAAALRWATFGAVHARHVIAWGAALPDDVLAHRTPVNGATLTAVFGTQDPVLGEAGPEIEEQIFALRARGHDARLRTYEGGHVIDDATLRELVAAFSTGP